MISQRISLMIFVLSLSYHSRVTNGQSMCITTYVHTYMYSNVLTWIIYCTSLVNDLLECLNLDTETNIFIKFYSTYIQTDYRKPFVTKIMSYFVM